MSKRIIEPGRIYKHFKGTKYYVRGIGEHTETGETMVIYSKSSRSDLCACEPKTYVRPYGMFISKVDKEKYPEATQEYRFELVEDK